MSNNSPRAFALLLAAALGLLAVVTVWHVSSSTVAPKPGVVATATPVGVASRDESAERVERSAPAPQHAAADDRASKRDSQLEALRARLDRPGVVPGEALLTFHSKDALTRFILQAAQESLSVLGSIPQLNSVRLQYSSLDQLREALAAAGMDASAVEGNPWMSIPPRPPAPETDNQMGAAPFGESTMNAIGAGGDRSKWGDQMTIAVLDSGVLDHPTFGQNQVTHLDLVNDGQTFNSHGTSVASLIGGQNPQAPGVTPGAQILDIRVANAEGSSVGSVLAEGIVMATDRGARVINISLGGYEGSAVLAQSVAYAQQHGAVVVAAAGNDDYNQIAIPAAYPGVISVGAVDANNQQAYFSNSGPGLTLSAPGVGVVTAWDTQKLALVSGTSQATALVTGAVAAYLGWGVPSSTVSAQLRTDARPTGGLATQVGAGVLTIKPPPGR